MGYFLGKGTFIKSNYGLSSNVSVFCRCYGYSIVTVLDALDHDPYCGFATNGFQPMLRWFRFVGFLPLLTVTCRCTGFSLATGIYRFYGFLLRCYGFFFVSLEVTLLRAFTAAMIVPCCEFSSVFSDLPIQGLCRGNGVSYITGFRCCE